MLEDISRHYGYRKIFEKSLIATGQVLIFVKDVHKLGDNPLLSQVNFISKDLVEFKNRFKIIKHPTLLIFFMEEKLVIKLKKLI